MPIHSQLQMRDSSAGSTLRRRTGPKADAKRSVRGMPTFRDRDQDGPQQTIEGVIDRRVSPSVDSRSRRHEVGRGYLKTSLPALSLCTKPVGWAKTRKDTAPPTGITRAMTADSDGGVGDGVQDGQEQAVEGTRVHRASCGDGSRPPKSL